MPDKALGEREMKNLVAILIFVVVALMSGCSEIGEEMFGKSKLQKILENWSVNKGDLPDALRSLGETPIKKKKDAVAVINALKQISFAEEQKEYQLSSPTHCLVAFFQQIETQEAFNAFRENGLPELRRLLDEGLKNPENRENDLMFIMKIMAMYRQERDAKMIVEVARTGFNADGYMWSVVFGAFDEDHQHWRVLLDGLSNPLPEDFICVAYLDFANGHAIEGRVEKHPFDSDWGLEKLKSWLSDKDEESFSYAHSAAASLPYLGEKSRSVLWNLARRHPDVGVRIESAWAAAKVGDAAGIGELKEWAMDVNHSTTACQYLAELGYEKEIPEQALGEDFKAMAEMADWLSHPNEYGRPPSKIERYDSRTLYWPPTDDERKVWLFKYEYEPQEEGDELDVGISMVGSVTFALFGEATDQLSPEEVYGLHCAWELEMNGDSRAPKERNEENGLKILKKYNSSM